jgi:predicted naringenin-chalcone synthase
VQPCVVSPHGVSRGDRTSLLDNEGFYCFGAFPDTGKPMAIYQREALPLALRALDQLDLGFLRHSLTHLIVTSCTGFYSPELDLQIVEQYDLKTSMNRSAKNALGRTAQTLVTGDPLKVTFLERVTHT